MQKDTSTVEIPAELRPVIHAAAKNLAIQLFGQQGPAWGTSLTTIEELTLQVTQQLGAELLRQALQRQAEVPPPAPLQSCPVCRGPLEPSDPEPRSVHTRAGLADWCEPARRCPRCRRAFFPSVGESGH